MKDKIEQIEISDIDTFKNHPFRVNQDESFNELIESIKTNGLMNPIVVRKKGKRYELISGHRRKEVMELLGNEYISAIVKDLLSSRLKCCSNINNVISCKCEE